MKVLFEIGHFPIYIFGFFIALGVMAGIVVAMLEAKRKKYDEDKLFNFILVAMVSGILGARIYFILAFNLDYYLENPIKIFAFRDGGLSIQGALIFGILGSLIYGKIKKINIWEVADIVAPGIILGQAIGRIGCDVFGVEMSKELFWGVSIKGQLLHPAQIYEAVLNFILFGILWSKRKSVKFNGQLFSIYLIGFSINRFIVEFFRTNPIVFGGLTIAHVTGIIMLIVSVVLYRILSSRGNIKKDNKVKKYDINIKELLVIISLIVISVTIYYSIWL